MARKVLIVEDEALIALDLKSRLQCANYSVVGVADNMEDALGLVDNKTPDIVLMDIRIRGQHDGIETAGLIRARYDIPVVFVTAYADRETLERAKLAEPFGYIMKPIVNVDFHAQIETVIWKHAMERKLRNSEAWLAATLRNVASAMIAADSQGIVAFMNPAAEELTGWKSEDARDQPLMEVLSLFEERTGLPMINPLEAIYDGRELSREPGVYQLVSRSGERTALVEASISANRAGGQVLGVVVVLQDVTARRHQEEQVRQMQKTEALSVLAEGISRDLMQKLKVIQMAILAMGREPTSTELAGTLQQIERASRGAQNLVEQLSLLGRHEFQVQPLDLARTIRGLSAALRKKLGPGRNLKLKLAQELPEITADEEALNRILLNLVSDACEAMPGGGVVEICVEPVGPAESPASSVRLLVRDSGRAMRAHAAATVFDPYSHSRSGGRDAGLSMTLVHHCVAMSGGTVEVKSEPNSGTAVVMTFPAVPVRG